jgi:hypothetical protein
MELKHILKDYQKETVEYMLQHPYCIVALQMGLGKAQKNSSLVYTPEGPRKMGELKVGNYVIGQDGTKKKILGVFPQGVKKVFRVTFHDGSFADCCEDHLWNVRTAHDKWIKRNFKTIPLKQIKKTIKIKCGNKWEIPIVSSPVEFTEKEVLIDPYILGILIGDGSLKHGAMFTNASMFIAEKVKGLLPAGYSLKSSVDENSFNHRISYSRESNPFKKYLECLGLNVLGKVKFIPDIYKYNSIQVRKDLLTGLVDTDGYVSKDGMLQYTSASERLIDDVMEIVQSLGGVARKNYKLSKCQTGLFPSWTITICMPPDIIPVSKPDKLEKYRPKTKYLPSRYIDKVEEIGEEECTCISVEDSLYLTDHFVVTHNTICAIATKLNLENRRCLVICPAYLVLNWKNEINKFTKNQVITIFKKHADVFFPVDSDFVVCSYDIAVKSELIFEWANMIVIDEAHALKNMNSKRSKEIHRKVFEYNIERLYLLTGTPIKNRVEEFYSLIALCNYNPTIKESAFLEKFKEHVSFADQFSFRQEYERMVTTKKGYKQKIKVVKWDGIKNEGELKMWLKGIYVSKKSKSDPIIYMDVVVDDADKPELLAAFNESKENSVAPQIKVESAVLKVPFTYDYVKDLIDNNSGPVIIYSDHIAPCEELGKLFDVTPITGSMSPEDRSEMAEKFQRGEIPVLVATIKSFSTGFNLTASNNIVFNDFSWVPADMSQAEHRINRIGQTKQCYVHRIIGSVQDNKILQALDEKMKVIGTVV